MYIDRPFYLQTANNHGLLTYNLLTNYSMSFQMAPWLPGLTWNTMCLGNKATFCVCWWLQALIQWTLLLVTRHYCLALFLGKSVLLEIWGWVAVIKAITWGSILRYSAQYSLILFACVWGPEWLLLYFFESSMWKTGLLPAPTFGTLQKGMHVMPSTTNHLNLANSYVTSQNATIRWDVITLPHIPILLHTHSWRCRWLPQLWESSHTFKCRSMWTEWTLLVCLQCCMLTLQNSSLRSMLTYGSLHYVSNGEQITQALTSYCFNTTFTSSVVSHLS